MGNVQGRSKWVDRVDNVQGRSKWVDRVGNVQGRSKWVDRVDNVQGPDGPGGPQPKLIQKTIGLGALTVPCPWAPEVLATPVQIYTCIHS